MRWTHHAFQIQLMRIARGPVRVLLISSAVIVMEMGEATEWDRVTSSAVPIIGLTCEPSEWRMFVS